MSSISFCCYNGAAAPPTFLHKVPLQPITLTRSIQRRQSTITTSASKGFSFNSIFFKSCKSCEGKGAIECPGCKGSGKNKKNGNVFERWKCFGCQGFGLISCPSCGKGGLTPEQTGER
ncbi:putative Heat shock protein DnaJ, cysteine-rich [Medicago truncatula]|uniref:Plant/F12K8-2 protein, putative n=1 Tax=Medicago truncatula TaxID=3880 RepID=A0A072UHX1_MEDTR|nr:protein PHOTOSYSTEM I ASSEMBLY 2, chloroplastic [Medicago truncatula]KEH29272.1 plant/F12K8-2 protein, putative [Medicago truncatula]RHN59550.1 putative Heat shock protein DnaJ, cysteine-rich [Medicago truncatula]